MHAKVVAWNHVMFAFTGPGTTLPHWEQTSTSHVYSSNVSANSGHEDITSPLKSDHDNHSGERNSKLSLRPGTEDTLLWYRSLTVCIGVNHPYFIFMINSSAISLFSCP